MKGVFSKVGLCIFSACCLLLAGCNPRGPVETINGQPDVPIERSSIVVPIGVKASTLNAALNAKFNSKPVIRGRTPELSAKLLVAESRTVQREVQELVEAAVPAVCVIKRIPETITERVRVGTETFRCALTPWKWGSCARDVFRDVTRTVWKDVTECTIPKPAVFRTVLKPFVELQDKLFPTSIWINYEGWVHDAKVNMAGSVLQAAAGFRFKASADYKQGALGGSVTVKGALSCTIDIDVGITARAAINAEGIIDINVIDFKFDPQKFCVPGAVEIANLGATLNADVQLLRITFGDLIKKELVKLINKQIRKSTEEARDLRDKISNLGDDLQIAKPIGSSSWIQVRPESVFLSDFSGRQEGDQNIIGVTAGIVGRPLVTIGQKPKPEALRDIPFGTNPGPIGVHLLVQARIPAEAARATLQKNLRSFMDERFPNSEYTLDIGRVYQSGKRMIIAVSVLRKRDSRRIFTGYFSAVSFLTGDSGVGLRDVRIDDDTRKAMIKFADWLVNSGVESYIERVTRFDLDGEIRKITAILNPFTSVSNDGILSGRCQTFGTKGLWVADDALNLLAVADCQANYEITKANIN